MENQLKYNFFSFTCGLLFSIGLALSGMLNPNNIVGFLNIFGEWNPTLAFVMVGAVGVYLAAFPLIQRRQSPLFDKVFRLPEKQDIDHYLVLGAILFGAGWGISGLCPGPSVVSLVTGDIHVVTFFVNMMIGMYLALRFKNYHQ